MTEIAERSTKPDPETCPECWLHYAEKSYQPMDSAKGLPAKDLYVCPQGHHWYWAVED